jgi:hypothetical protein
VFARALLLWIPGASLLLPSMQAAAFCVAISCSSGVTVSNDPNQCGAFVDYPEPEGIFVPPGDCGTIICSPPAGSFFPVGSTPVNCVSSGPDCEFLVTVNDTQPPQMSAPPPQIVIRSEPDPSALLSYTTPIASDNCPGLTAGCSPPSGTSFPPAHALITCTATDASGNTATSSTTLSYFDACVKDDDGGEFVRWNSGDGVYELFDCDASACGGGITRTGTGEAKPTHGGFQIQDQEDDGSVRASIAVGSGKGRATFKFRTGASKLTTKLKDADFRDNSCSCPP